MPRHARIVPCEGYLHIICRGNNRRKLFLRPRDFEIYYLILKKLKNEEKIKILHYCFMSNHVHLLVGITEESGLSRFMKRLNIKYSNYYRKKRTYVGHLWQDRFQSKVIETDEYFIQCGKYIELNPVRAGLVKFPEEYRFSSFSHYGLGLEDKLIDDDPLYIDLGRTAVERQIVYRNIFLNEVMYENKSL